MANKKLLTLDDLISFCKDNQMNCFNAKETGYDLIVQVPARLEFAKRSDEKNRQGLLYCVFKVCHTELNRNGSYISEKNMKKAMPSLKYRPVLAHIHQLDDGTYDFHSHDMDIDENGNTVYIEKQIGCFTSDDPYLEYDEENDKTYVIATAVIPEDYTMASEIIRRNNGSVVSCELSIEDMSYNAKKNYLELNDFYFSGVTCLGAEKNGKRVKEGMAGSRLDIKDFSAENNSAIKYSNIDTKLIDTLEKLNITLSKFNIDAENAENDSKKGGFEKLTKLEELLAKYEVVKEDLSFEVDGLSDEELEAKFAEVFGENAEASNDESTFVEEVKNDAENTVVEEDTATVVEENSEDNNNEEDNKNVENDGEETEVVEEPVNEDNANDNSENVADYSVKYSIEIGGNTRTFEVSLNEKLYALENLVNITYSESDNTYYSIKAYDNYVIMIDYWSGRAYKQSYKLDENDSFMLTGDREEVFSTYVTADEQRALDEMKANYALISEKLSNYEKAEIDAQKETILADEDYAQFAETDEFKAIRKEMDNLTVDELKTKCELAFAKLVRSNKTFAMNTTTTKSKNRVGIVSFAQESDDESEPYGDYFRSLRK